MLVLGILGLVGALIIAVIGFPLARLLVVKLPSKFHRGSFLLSTSLLVGFSILSIASAWSFGLFGLGYFLPILGVIFVIGLAANTYTYFKKTREKVSFSWSIFDLGYLLILPVAVFSNRAYTDPDLGLGFRAGTGPDIAQNMMTFVGSKSRGETWLQLQDLFLNSVQANSLYDGVYKIYTASSFQAQAVFDYLLYGTRWGLSVPAIISNDLFGHENTILYPALISTLGLLSIGFITYGFLSAIIKNLLLAICVSLTTTASGAIIYQTYNGGLAQAWALPGLGALSLLLLNSYFQQKQVKNTNSKYMILLMAISWIAIAVPYFDAALVMALLIVLIALTQLIITKFKNGDILKQFALSGLVAAILVLPFSLVSLYTFPIRMRLASGTGINAPNWPLPSELFSFGDAWVNPRSGLAQGVSLIVSLTILSYFIRGIISKDKDQVALGQIGITIFAILGFAAFAASVSVAGNNYIYMKVGAYLAPIAISGFYLLLTAKSMFHSGGLLRGDTDEVSIKATKKKVSILQSIPYIPIIFTFIAIYSSQITINGLIPQGVFFPKDFGKITVDAQAQELLTEKNYFLYFTPSSNIVGAFGDVTWINKAPNDLDLSLRADKEIRILCYSFVKECRPPGAPISEPSLEKFGLLSYQSSITIAEYEKLSIRERYAKAFEQIGQTPVQIPERYIGGNPLLKSDK